MLTVLSFSLCVCSHPQNPAVVSWRRVQKRSSETDREAGAGRRVSGGSSVNFHYVGFVPVWTEIRLKIVKNSCSHPHRNTKQLEHCSFTNAHIATWMNIIDISDFFTLKASCVNTYIIYIIWNSLVFIHSLLNVCAWITQRDLQNCTLHYSALGKLGHLGFLWIHVQFQRCFST